MAKGSDALAILLGLGGGFFQGRKEAREDRRKQEEHKQNMRMNALLLQKNQLQYDIDVASGTPEEVAKRRREQADAELQQTQARTKAMESESKFLDAYREPQARSELRSEYDRRTLAVMEQMSQLSRANEESLYKFGKPIEGYDRQMGVLRGMLSSAASDKIPGGAPGTASGPGSAANGFETAPEPTGTGSRAKGRVSAPFRDEAQATSDAVSLDVEPGTPLVVASDPYDLGANYTGLGLTPMAKDQFFKNDDRLQRFMVTARRANDPDWEKIAYVATKGQADPRTVTGNEMGWLLEKWSKYQGEEDPGNRQRTLSVLDTLSRSLDGVLNNPDNYGRTSKEDQARYQDLAKRIAAAKLDLVSGKEPDMAFIAEHPGTKRLRGEEIAPPAKATSETPSAPPDPNTITGSVGPLLEPFGRGIGALGLALSGIPHNVNRAPGILRGTAWPQRWNPITGQWEDMEPKATPDAMQRPVNGILPGLPWMGGL